MGVMESEAEGGEEEMMESGCEGGAPVGGEGGAPVGGEGERANSPSVAWKGRSDWVCIVTIELTSRGRGCGEEGG